MVIMKNRAWRRAYLVATAVVSAATLSGNVAVVTIGAAVLGAAGARLHADSFPAVMMLGSTASMLLMERLGRRVILGWSFCVGACAQACLATALLLPRLAGGAGVAAAARRRGRHVRVRVRRAARALCLHDGRLLTCRAAEPGVGAVLGADVRAAGAVRAAGGGGRHARRLLRVRGRQPARRRCGPARHARDQGTECGPN
ncbi:uncharacterized protein LOC125237649 [Leguminivora glycinivorella]|uniref:uncharacterized protein LOC125237649 n=1 Tax=Leguminivora glycinivorella TaxID=1035111 RepID=UPI00200E3955|nr:uncharacterized protein LOC125237649 [Leguminivora glycinivorella]